MAVPSTFSELSATPASNSGLIAGSMSPNVLDDHLRTVYAFLASVYANSGNGWASQYLPAAGGTVSGNLAVTGTLTGSTGVMDIGGGQIYKSAAGNVTIGAPSSGVALTVSGQAKVGTGAAVPGASCSPRAWG